MKKLLLTFVCLPLMLLTVQGQVLYQDSLVKITGYLSEVDSCLVFQIENVSDSVLILNEKNINFDKVRTNEWAADLSLSSSGLSLLQPSFGHFMSFKRLKAQEKYTAIAYSFPLPKKADLFKLFVQIDYMAVTSDFTIVDNITYKEFIELIKKEELKIHSFKGELEINEKGVNNPCKSFFKSK